MKIKRITVWQINLPLKEPYRLSGGRLEFDTLDSTLIRIDTDEDLSGWGEGCPWGNTYLPAHGRGLRACLPLLAPCLLGKDPRSLQYLNQMMDITLPGHAYAKSALDMALWDILGKATNMPVWQLMGGERAEPVLVNSSISTGTPDQMIALIKQAGDQGYRVHSVKIGGDESALDIERIEAISAALPQGHKVTFDVNRAWTPALAIQVLNSVQACDWVEQPCETLQQCAHVASRVQNPIMLDECMHGFQDHLEAWKTNACEGVKVKPNRVGGLTKALQIRDFGVSVGWQMHIEDVGGSILADTAAIHLASSTRRENRLASWLSHFHLAVDLAPEQGARNQNGEAAPPVLPGLGIFPDENRLGDPVACYD